MTTRRPGAPRTAGRPVGASKGKARAGSGAKNLPRANRAGRTAKTNLVSRFVAKSQTENDPQAPQPHLHEPQTRSVNHSMRNLQQNSLKFITSVTSRAWLVLLLVVFALGGLLPLLNAYVSQRQQIAELSQEVSSQRDRVEALKIDIKRWEDPAYVAAQARTRLLYAYPGETQYRLTDASGKDIPLTEDQKAEEQAHKLPWYASLWESLEGASNLRPEDIQQTQDNSERSTPDK